MTKILNTTAYPYKTPINQNDYVIGTDSELSNKQTKNFRMEDIREFLIQGLSPELGGTLKITEKEYNGILTSPADVANALSPYYSVSSYEIVIFNINGDKYILKLQGLNIGVGQDPISDSDFISLIGLTKLGSGINVLKGYNTSTKKQEFYGIKSTGNDVSLVSGDIVIDPKAGENLGSGQPIYSGLNPVTKIHEFYEIKSTGNQVSLVSGDVVIDPKAGENLGGGKPIYKGLNSVTKIHEFRTIDSTSLTIIEDGDLIRINQPETSSIPALYVNSLYEPTYDEFLAGNTKGLGTLAKPFTDTITSWPLNGSPVKSANTSIQNALDAYVDAPGGGTRLLPGKAGQKIVVQNNINGYTFVGDLGYSRLYIVFEGNVVCTRSGYLIDMDNTDHFNAINSIFTIEIKEGAILEVQGLGFNNSGNTSSTPPSYDSGRLGEFLGEGTLYSNYNGPDVLTRYIFNGDGNNNDDGLHFNVKCVVRANYQGIYLCQNKMRIDFYNIIKSSNLQQSVNLSLQAFRMTGGQVRFYEKGGIDIGGDASGRTYAITFQPTGAGVGYCIFQLNSARISGSANYMFARLNNQPVDFLAFNSPSGSNFATVIPGTGTVVNGLFQNLGIDKWQVKFTNNVFSFTGIDFTKVDLTQGNTLSSINFIRDSVIQSLVTYPSKKEAASYGLPLNSLFKQVNTFTPGQFVVGQQYRIKTLGVSPNFVANGAASNTVGLWFTAINGGSGTGTADLEQVQIV